MCDQADQVVPVPMLVKDRIPLFLDQVLGILPFSVLDAVFYDRPVGAE